ncbi:hypothetical protein GCM10023340_39730 [Nocardioides marinquilinus]|uniref:TetR family transcriptional regulator n=1 Tax=Nocardioides marinquilinus TaxID=1210400 RepID=A0ABP9Q304_9ACTN
MRRQPRVSRLRTYTDAAAATGRRVLVAAGYDGLDLDRVAEQAGLDAAVLRHYLPDRDDLVALVLERWPDDDDPALRRSVVAELPAHLRPSG